MCRAESHRPLERLRVRRSNQGIGQRACLNAYGAINGDRVAACWRCRPRCPSPEWRRCSCPAALGVPRIAPPESSVRPGGNVPELTDQEGPGPPLATSGCVVSRRLWRPAATRS